MKRKLVLFLTSLTDETIKKLAAAPEGEAITSWITVMRTGKFYDSRYDWFDITLDQIHEMEKHFQLNVVGLEVPILFGHYGPDNAAGWHKNLQVEGNRLRALIEWTPIGVQAILNKEFKYVSSEYDENYQDNETGTNLGCVYTTCALTNRPVIRNQDPVSLSHSATGPDDEIRVAFHPELEKQLSKNKSMEEPTMKKWEKLVKRLLAMSGLPEDRVKALAIELEKKITDDTAEDDVHKLAQEAVDAARKVLAKPEPVPPAKPATPPPAEPPATTPPSEPKMLSHEDVDARVQKALEADRENTRKLAEDRQTHIDEFEKKLTDQEGLDDDTRKSLSEDFKGFVLGNMPKDMADRYADRVLGMAEKSIAARELTNMGFQIDGKVIVGDEQDHKRSLAFCDFLDEKVLKLSATSAAERHPNCRELTPRNKDLAEKALAEYDRLHGRNLMEEGKRFLAGGPTGIGDTTIGTSLFSVGRTLLREALMDLVATNFVAATLEGVDVKSPTIYIPFVYRERESSLLKDLVRYQAETIGRAQMIQSGENAYISPLKLATALYNELLNFGPQANINYNPLQENLTICTRIIKEAIDELLITEIVQADDEFGATAVSNEDLAAQTDGSNTTFQLGLVGGVLTKFPLVKPRLVYDLTGSQIGSTVNPIVVTYDGGVLSEYDGSGTQAGGNYYKITDWALAQFQIVSELGAVQTPAADKTLVVSYYYSTNRTLFDFEFDAGVTDWEKHLNGLLRAFGRSQADMAQNRFYTPNYILMSNILNQYCGEAKKWSPMHRTEGMTMTDSGNAKSVAGLPTFKTASPASLLGEKRGIIGMRDATKYVITHPWSYQTALTEMIDGTTGKFIGGKHTYGQQFHAIHTPGGPSGKLKGQCTQIIAYDSKTNANGGDVGPF